MSLSNWMVVKIKKKTSREPLNGLLDWLSAVFASWGVGFSPVASGTVASAVAVALWAMLSEWKMSELIALIVVVTILGTLASQRLVKKWGKDPSAVIVDEIAGQWLTLIFLPFCWQAYVVGFFAFRLFDVLKPFPVNRLEALPGGVGIMADDLGAAVYAAIVSRVLLHFIL